MNNKAYKIIQLPKHFDPRGNLTVAEETKNVPFKIGCTQWLYGMDCNSVITFGDAPDTQYFIVALSGSFNINIGIQHSEEKIFMNHPYEAVYLKTGNGIKITDCANGSIILIMSDQPLKN